MISSLISPSPSSPLSSISKEGAKPPLTHVLLSALSTTTTFVLDVESLTAMSDSSDKSIVFWKVNVKSGSVFGK